MPADRLGVLTPGRWTAAAADAVDRAGDEARALGHDHVGTEHVLLTLTSPGVGAAAAVLAHLGITRDRILATSCMRAGAGERAADGCLEVMPRLKQALEHGRRIADALGAPLAGTEHLLAGLVAVPDSMAVEILRRLHTRPDDVRAALAERLHVDPRQLGATGRRRWLRRRRDVAARED